MKLTKAIQILKQHNDSRRLGTEKVNPINLASAIDEVINYHKNLLIDNSEIKEVELYNKKEIEILSLESKRIFESGIALSNHINALKRKECLTETEKKRLERYLDEYKENITQPMMLINKKINELELNKISTSQLGLESEYFKN